MKPYEFRRWNGLENVTAIRAFNTERRVGVHELTGLQPEVRIKTQKLERVGRYGCKKALEIRTRFLYFSCFSVQAKDFPIPEQELIPEAILREWNVGGKHDVIDTMKSFRTLNRMPERMPLRRNHRTTNMETAMMKNEAVSRLQ